MISVVCWKWRQPSLPAKFGPETVNVLRSMVARHYPHPHRFICVTDDAAGIDPAVEILPDFGDFAGLPSPHGVRNPACYRRLRLFHPQAAQWFGDRVVSIDLDLVLAGDVSALWNRPEPFVMYGDTNPTTFYNGSMVLLTAGARPSVWEDFDPLTSPSRARGAGQHGSDQAWISYCLGPGEARFTRHEGVYSYRNEIAPHGGDLPTDARIVVFHGRVKPWDAPAQSLRWVRECWQ